MVCDRCLNTATQHSFEPCWTHVRTRQNGSALDIVKAVCHEAILEGVEMHGLVHRDSEGAPAVTGECDADDTHLQKMD